MDFSNSEAFNSSGDEFDSLFFTTPLSSPFPWTPAPPPAPPAAPPPLPPPAIPPRASKKRSRASRRAPTTVLTTDTSNFRAMVQEFTGIPTPPFSFIRPRLDLLGSFRAPSVPLGLTNPFAGLPNLQCLLRPPFPSIPGDVLPLPPVPPPPPVLGYDVLLGGSSEGLGTSFLWSNVEDVGEVSNQVGRSSAAIDSWVIPSD